MCISGSVRLQAVMKIKVNNHNVTCEPESQTVEDLVDILQAWDRCIFFARSGSTKCTLLPLEINSQKNGPPIPNLQNAVALLDLFVAPFRPKNKTGEQERRRNKALYRLTR